jgi:hypothetical protein
MVWLTDLFAFGVCQMDDTVHIPYIVDRLDEIIDLYKVYGVIAHEDRDDVLSAVEELRRELIFNMGVNALARHKDHDQELLDGSDDTSNPVIKLRGFPNDG